MKRNSARCSKNGSRPSTGAIEIQIRTFEMHMQVEYGFASHADYKHQLYALRANNTRATALDFVCAMQPDRCAKVVAVRINRREQPLETPLRDGDTVEVMTETAELRMQEA